jgi:hypothetical protein
MSIIPALGKLREEDIKFKVNCTWPVSLIKKKKKGENIQRSTKE